MAARSAQYESRVVREIAVWKERRPSFVSRGLNQVSRPFSWAVGRMLPESVVNGAVAATYTTSRWLANPRPVLSAAGVPRLADLRRKSLKLSDELSRRTSQWAQAVAVVDGVVTGAGGLPLVPLDVGALTLITLHGIHRTGQCYGYALDEPQDRPYMLAILMLAGTGSLRARRELFGCIREFRDWVLARTIESLALESLTQQLLRIVCLESIPGFGAVIGSLANLAFVRQVLTDCRRVFQERWLRENGYAIA